MSSVLINDWESPILSRRESGFISVLKGIKLLGVEFDSLILFGLGDSKSDHD